MTAPLSEERIKELAYTICGDNALISKAVKKALRTAAREGYAAGIAAHAKPVAWILTKDGVDTVSHLTRREGWNVQVVLEEPPITDTERTAS